jgi:hypothetical protein
MRAHFLLALGVLAQALPSSVALAQKPNLGSYVGTATILSTETSGKNRSQTRATVKVTIPVTNAGGSGTSAEVDDVDKPSATASITELTSTREETSRGADGKFATESCKLSKPVDLPMNVQGSLSLDHRKKTYTVFIAMVGLKQFPVDCVHSQSGAHKKQVGAAFALGTHDPSQAPVSLPYTDPARLVAKHKLVVGGTTTIEQEWVFQLQR